MIITTCFAVASAGWKRWIQKEDGLSYTQTPSAATLTHKPLLQRQNSAEKRLRRKNESA